MGKIWEVVDFVRDFATKSKGITSAFIGINWSLWNSVKKGSQVKYRLANGRGLLHPRIPGGGTLKFFSGRGVRPGFPKYGVCELTFASEKGACERKIFKFGGLWAENFQIWGLVSWKFPNLGACELRFWWKLRLLRLKFPNFLKRGSCELTPLLEMGPLRAAGEAWKGGLQGRTSPYPLSRSVPPPPGPRIKGESSVV